MRIYMYYIENIIKYNATVTLMHTHTHHKLYKDRHLRMAAMQEEYILQLEYVRVYSGPNDCCIATIINFECIHGWVDITNFGLVYWKCNNKVPLININSDTKIVYKLKPKRRTRIEMAI